MNHELAESIIASVRTIASFEIKSKLRQIKAEEIFEKTSPMDLVTDVDLRVEQRLCDDLKKIMPDALIIGEEAVSSDPVLLEQLADAPQAVVIDPVDGTWNFAHGISLVGVIIAVVENGVTTFGLLYDPLQDDWVYACKGQGTFWQNHSGMRKQLKVETSDRGVGLCSPYLFDDSQREQVAAQLLNFKRVLSLGCSCHEYRTLVTGGADFYFTQKNTKPWDHLAGLLIHNEAGGYAACLDGSPYHLVKNSQNLLVASSKKNWQKLATIFSFE